ncbi:PorP/SprF family type IX secretion system membrane protein [candidate division KSB1 bacterium]
MKTRFKIIFFTVLFVLTLSIGKSQETYFTQYFNAPIYLNPALSGYESCSRMATLYHNLWRSSAISDQTYIFSYDQFFKQLSGSFAIRYLYNNIDHGAFKMNTVYATYAPKFNFFDDKMVLSVAIEAGWRKKKLYWDEFMYSVPSNQTSSKETFDINGGILITFNNFVCGAAFHHITEPEEGLVSTSRLPLKATFHLTYQWKLSELLNISPTLLYLRQMDTDIYNSNVAVSYRKIRSAIGYSYNTIFYDNRANIYLGFNLNYFTIGYCYELSMSKINDQTINSHEVNIMARFHCKNK